MKPLVLCSFLLLSLLNAEELKLDPYISDLKHKEFSYDYEKSILERKKLRDSWIQPLQLRYTISKSNPYNEQGASTQKTQNAAIVMDQPIFQSGGIYYGIKFAEASYEYNKYSIDVAKRKLIKEAVQLLMQIKQNELSLQRQKLQIDNSRISLEQKQEQYLNGQLDSGFLNNAIIEKNVVTQKLFDLQTNHERLISKFEAISDLDYKEATVPHLKLVSSEDFLEHNIDIKQLQSERERNRFNKNVTIAKYLPKVSLTAGYNWDKQEDVSFMGAGSAFNPPETEYYNYGLKATIPIDINTFRDVESSRVEYLKSLVVIDDKKRELTALYEQVTQNLINFDKKIKLSIENKALYSKLLDETSQLYTAGYKTEYDVRNLANSVEIEKVDQRIFELDKQLELLNLYEKLVNVTPLREEHIESAPIQFTQKIEEMQAPEDITVSVESDPVTEEKTGALQVPLIDKESNITNFESVGQDVNELQSAYYIQVASFASSAPDKVLLKKIKENNFSYLLYKVKVNDKMVTKVLIGPIEKNMDDALNEVREKVESDAYLLKI